MVPLKLQSGCGRCLSVAIIAAALTVGFGALPGAPAIAAPLPLNTSTLGEPPPVTTTGPDGTLIEVKNPVPASGSGVFYRPVSPLDPNKVYKVTVDGAHQEGNFVLRLGHDSKLDYRAAPKGKETWWVTDTTQLELLLFSPVPAKYLVRSVSIEECVVGCKRDSDLKAQILAETPGLESALKSGNDHASAALILRWLAPRTTWGSDASTMVEVRGRGAAELYYDYFEPLRGGVYCAGASDFFHKVLKLFDIPSFVVSFGNISADPVADPPLTHATVIVPVADDSGGTAYRLLDPTFNLDVSVKSSNKPASVQEMFELWRAGKVDRLSFNTRTLAERRIIFTGAAPLRCGDPVARARGFACELSDWLAQWKPWFERHGYQTGEAGLLQVFGTEHLLTPDHLGVPKAFQDMHAKFKSGGRVAALPVPPTLKTAPAVTGDAAVGATLESSDGAWDSTTGKILSMSFQWWRCGGGDCTVLQGATARRYTVTAADAGHRLVASVRARNEHGASEPVLASSDPVPPLETPPAPPAARAPAEAPPPPGASVEPRRLRIQLPGLRKQQRLGTALRRGVKVPVRCSADCTVNVKLEVRGPIEARLQGVAKRSVALRSGRPGYLRVRLGRSAAQELSEARKVRLVLTVSATDRSGTNTPAKRRSLLLER